MIHAVCAIFQVIKTVARRRLKVLCRRRKIVNFEFILHLQCQLLMSNCHFYIISSTVFSKKNLLDTTFLESNKILETTFWLQIL